MFDVLNDINTDGAGSKRRWKPPSWVW